MVNINGEEWRVLMVSPHHHQLKTSQGTYSLGSCNDLVKTIFINEELNDFYVKKVLCHELTHAAMFSYNIYLSYEQEEVLADLLATYGQEIINMTNLIFKRIKGGA